jgi:hypothetical protein
LVLCIHSNTVGYSHSGSDNKSQEEIEFQDARFVDTAVLHRRCYDNFESHRQTDKQMFAAWIFDSVLFLFADISIR